MHPFIVGCICLSAENNLEEKYLASACRVAAAIPIADAHSAMLELIAPRESAADKVFGYFF